MFQLHGRRKVGRNFFDWKEEKEEESPEYLCGNSKALEVSLRRVWKQWRMVLNKKWLFGINFLPPLFSSVLDILSSANDEWRIIRGITISRLQDIKMWRRKVDGLIYKMKIKSRLLWNLRDFFPIGWFLIFSGHSWRMEINPISWSNFGENKRQQRKIDPI